MTLVVVAGSMREVIQVSDRRLTVSNDGRSVVFDEEYNKAGTLNVVDGRLAFAFTGPARIGSFSTIRWMNDALLKCGPPDYSTRGVLDRFVDLCTNDLGPTLRGLGLSDAQIRMTFLFSGYWWRTSRGALILKRTLPFDCEVTNEQASGGAGTTFTREFSRHKYWVNSIGTLGDAGARMIEEAVVPLLASGRPACAIRDTLVDRVQRIADLPESQGVVGKQVSSIVVPRRPEAHPDSRYHTAADKFISYRPSSIVLHPTGGVAVLGMSIEVAEKDRGWAPPIARREVGRNEPCPCGSGKRYRQCCRPVERARHRASQRKH